MGRKWRTLITPKEVDMIEHSITKYKPAPNVVVPYVSNVRSLQPISASKYYTKSTYDAYILSLNMKGYVIGRKVTTTWGIEATIHRFFDCPAQGQLFYTNDKPDVMYILRDGVEYTAIAYSEDELILDEQQS